jgi:D-glycero-D-manno-heptose 1,7-bisphosphate phosphatase
MTGLACGAARSEPGAPRFSTVFLDRDGTVNVKAPEGQYVTLPGDLALVPGAAAAISRLNAASVQVILVTNQSWLSGLPNVVPYERVHARLEELLAEQGAHLDAAYYCPHAPGACRCRKPAPGMLERAAEERRFSLTDAVMIGDRESDIAAGRAAGTATILLSAERETPISATYIAADLAEAVLFILSVWEADVVLPPIPPSGEGRSGICFRAAPCQLGGPPEAS